MIRILTLFIVVLALVLSVRAILADTDPRRLKAAAWGGLSGALIVGGLWMILGD